MLKAAQFLVLTLALGCKPQHAQVGKAELTADEEDPPSPLSYEPGRVPTFTFWNLDPAALSIDARQGLAYMVGGKAFHQRQVLSFALMTLPPGSVLERLRSYGDIPSPFRGKLTDKEFPLNVSVFEREGVVYTHNNCLQCHATPVGNMIVAGVTNRMLNAPALVQQYGQLRRLLPLARATMDEKTRQNVDDNVAYLDRIVQPTFKHATTIGDNQGAYVSWLGVAHMKAPGKSLDDSFGPSDVAPLAELVLGKPTLPTTDPMPWWTVKYKSHFYWYADSATEPAETASNFALNFHGIGGVGPRTSFAARVENLARMTAYVRALVSPPFPSKLDTAAVERGRALFHGESSAKSGATASCAGCHGTYTPADDGWVVDYPQGRLLHEVGTDGAYSQVVRSFAPLAAHVNAAGPGQGYPAPRIILPDEAGYAAPPLDGVWASAPYFHNGSVPTLAAVLDPKDRPETWARDGDPTAYDFERVGIVMARGTPKKWTTYDTREFGKGRDGHTFGKIFDPAERKDVIEFLKALGGKGMRPAP